VRGHGEKRLNFEFRISNEELRMKKQSDQRRQFVILHSKFEIRNSRAARRRRTHARDDMELNTAPRLLLCGDSKR
jgi:hypothetical protein